MRRNVPPMVGSLFSWKSSFTNRSTSEDWFPQHVSRVFAAPHAWLQDERPTLPTAASPSRTSLTLLLGLGAAAVDVAMRWCDGKATG